MYKKTDYLGQRKSLSLTYDTNMKIDVYAVDGDSTEHLSTFSVNSLDDIATNDVAKKEGSSKPKVTLSFELTRSGLIQLNKVEAKIDEIYYVEERVKTNKTKTADEKTEEISEKNDTESDNNETSSSYSKSNGPVYEMVKKEKKRTQSFPVYRIDKQHYGLT